MTEYKSIKEDVFKNLEENMPEIQKRFGLGERSSASISRLIKEACDVSYIKKLEDTAPRYTKYVP